MTRLRVEDKVSSWLTVYNAIAGELTPRPLREVAARQPSSQQQHDDMLAALRLVTANDRTAALVAAMLVGSGGVTRVIPSDALEEAP